MSFSSPFSKSPEKKVDDGNKLKLEQKWMRAGEKFLKAAELFRNEGADFECAKCLNEAANCFVKDDSRRAILALKEAAGIYGELGHISFAAGLHKKIAELALGLERNEPSCFHWTNIGGHSQLGKREHHNMEQEPQESAVCLATKHYAKAADFYKMEESPANEAECREERAKILADSGKQKQAAEELKQLTEHAEKHKLLSASKHAFQACLCRLAVGQDPEVDEMGRMCPRFAGSDHSRFVRDLAVATGETAVLEARREFEKFNQLDEWQGRRFSEVKQRSS